MPVPLGGNISKSIRQIAALLELERRARADQPRRQLAEVRLVADQRDARLLAHVLAELLDHRRRGPGGRQRVAVVTDGFDFSVSANTSAVCRVRTSGLVMI